MHSLKSASSFARLRYIAENLRGRSDHIRRGSFELTLNSYPVLTRAILASHQEIL